MCARRDYVTEIREIRNRTGPSDWDNGVTKLLFLTTSAANLKSEGEELGYFPVAVIAAIESFFRWEIRTLVDSDDERYIANLRIDELLKVDHDLLLALHGKQITIGELIAHLVRLGSFEAIGATMTQLLGAHFLELLKNVPDPEKLREMGERAPKVIEAPDTVFAAVKRAFHLRNIICHEAHLESPVQIDEVKHLCSRCYEFAVASHYAIGLHFNPNPPLTLNERYEATKEEIEKLDAEIVSLEKRITPALDPGERKSFEEMQNAWRSFVRGEADFASSHQMNGNRGAVESNITTVNAYRNRIETLNDIVKATRA